jgi:hypothetical protein
MTVESSVLLDEIGRNPLLALRDGARLGYAELGRRVVGQFESSQA